MLLPHRAAEPTDRDDASALQPSASDHSRGEGTPRLPGMWSRVHEFGGTLRQFVPVAIWLSAALVVAGAALQGKQPPDRLTPLFDHTLGIGFVGSSESEIHSGLSAAFNVSLEVRPSLSNLGRCGRWAIVEVIFFADSRYLRQLSRGPAAAPRALPHSLMRLQAEISSLVASGRTRDLTAREESRMDTLERALGRAKLPMYERRTAPEFAVHVDGGGILSPSLEAPPTNPDAFVFFHQIAKVETIGRRQREGKSLVVEGITLYAKSEDDVSSSGSMTATGRDLLGHLSLYAGRDIRAVAWSAEFFVPVVARHGLGSCWVRLPEIADGINDISRARSRVAGPFTLFTNPRVGLVDASDSQPSPNGANLTWTCDRRAPKACGAWALVDAPWRGTYRDVSLLLAGVMLSIAAELALRAIERKRR